MVQTNMLIAALVTLSCFVQINGLEDGTLTLLKRESSLAAAAVRNITLLTPDDQLQLASIAVDFVSDVNTAKHILNAAIPFIVTDEYYETLAEAVRAMSNISKEIEQAIPGDSEKLKEVLVTQLEYINALATNYQDIKTSNDFLILQIQKKEDFIIFALFNLKHHAIYFNKTNKELQPEIGNSINEFKKVMDNISSTDKAFDKQLRHTMNHIAASGVKAVYRLENWLDLNLNSTADVRVVLEIVKGLSEISVEVNKALNEDHDAEYLKKQLIYIYEVGTQEVSRFGDFNYPDKLGGIEFIRSTIIEAITIGKAYADILKGSIHLL